MREIEKLIGFEKVLGRYIAHREEELHNARVRISDRDLKIERQREQVTKLEASRKGLKTEIAAIKLELAQSRLDHKCCCEEFVKLQTKHKAMRVQLRRDPPHRRGYENETE